MEQYEIEHLVRRGGHLLAEALDLYWPTNGHNEVAERNTTLHLAHAFSEANFHVYAEGHAGDSTSTRLDLLAVHFGARVQVAIEAKRLYSTEQVARMHNDVERVSSFRMTNAVQPRGVSPDKLWGVVVGTTWNEEYARWFSGNDDAPVPSGHASIWEKFGCDSRLTAASWGSMVLRGPDYRLSHGKMHFLCYCVFPVGT